MRECAGLAQKDPPPPPLIYLFTSITSYVSCIILQVHLAGMMTDLPHHIATHSEMTGLLEAMHRLLQVTVSSPAGSPALVTIARYS